MQSLRLPGVELHYRIEGKGTPLLLIHGTQPDADTWGGCVGELAQYHQVIAYDRRGFSRSVHPPVQDYVTHAEDALALLRHLQAEPAMLVGWSWGGIIALEMAALAPEAVRQLILAEPALHLKKHPSFAIIRTILNVKLLRLFRSDVQAAESFLTWAHQYAGGGSAFEGFPEAVREVIRRNATAIVSEIEAGTGEKLLPQRIATIRCPVTCLLGEKSAPEFAPAVARLKSWLPGIRQLIIPGAGHALHFDQPEAFTAAILAAGREAGAWVR